MPYRVQFVGLMCFARENGTRVVLLPDARTDAPPHEPRIVVDPEMVIKEKSTWPVETLSRVARALGEFKLPSCTVSMSGAEDPGPFITTNHEPRLNGLKAIQPAFDLDPASPNAVVSMTIRQGILEAFRYPRSPADDPFASVISQLELEHEGEITITVTPKDGADPLTIVLQPGTEVALANDTMADESAGDHFKLYEKLDKNVPPAPLGDTRPNPEGVFIPVSRSRHRIFAGAVEDDLRCPNTGCCP